MQVQRVNQNANDIRYSNACCVGLILIQHCVQPTIAFVLQHIQHFVKMP